MDTIMEQIFDQKIKDYKNNANEPQTEKALYFFKRGMELQHELRNQNPPVPAIAAERHFDTVLEEDYPTTLKEYRECQRAFAVGFYVDLRFTI